MKNKTENKTCANCGWHEKWHGVWRADRHMEIKGAFPRPCMKFQPSGDSGLVPDQFCLSDEVILLNQKMNGIECDVYTEEDVKEFVRRLHNNIDKWKQDVLDTEKKQDKKYTDGALIAISIIKQEIDKLAGEKLI